MKVHVWLFSSVTLTLSLFVCISKKKKNLRWCPVYTSFWRNLHCHYLGKKKKHLLQRWSLYTSSLQILIFKTIFGVHVYFQIPFPQKNLIQWV